MPFIPNHGVIVNHKYAGIQRRNIIWWMTLSPVSAARERSRLDCTQRTFGPIQTLRCAEKERASMQCTTECIWCITSPLCCGERRERLISIRPGEHLKTVTTLATTGTCRRERIQTTPYCGSAERISQPPWHYLSIASSWCSSSVSTWCTLPCRQPCKHSALSCKHTALPAIMTLRVAHCPFTDRQKMHRYNGAKFTKKIFLWWIFIFRSFWKKSCQRFGLRSP